MITYFLVTEDRKYSAKVVFETETSEKGLLISRILKSEYPKIWYRIEHREDFVIDVYLVKRLLEQVTQDLSEILPVSSDPEGNHEIEFMGKIFKLSKLSKTFTKIYQLTSLFSLLKNVQEQKLILNAISLELFDDDDVRFTFSIITKYSGFVSQSNISATVVEHFKKNQISHSFKLAPEACVILLIEKGFIIQDGDKYKLSLKSHKILTGSKDLIKNFKWVSDDDITLNINLGVKVYIFENNEESLVHKFYKGQGKGLIWDYGGLNIEIREKRSKIEGLPSPDLQKVIVIYPMDHSAYPAPNNAAIHNADGSVYMQLSPPQLISDLAKQQQERDPKGPFMVHFEDVSWQYNNSGEVVACISIAYNRDWHEDRELNTETGEFGACLNSGRR